MYQWAVSYPVLFKDYLTLFFDWKVTHAPAGSWTHNPILHVPQSFDYDWERIDELLLLYDTIGDSMDSWL